MDKKRKINNSKRKQQVKRQLYFMAAAVMCIGIISTVFIIRSKKEEVKEAAIKIEQQNREKDTKEKKEEEIETFEGRLARVKEEASKKGYPKGVIELLDKNAETIDFVEDYEVKKDLPAAETLDEVPKGEIPLLLQWDERWGYAPYGKSIVAVSGCGPTCMAMVAAGLTGDMTATPAKLAAYGTENGYLDEENNTYWKFMNEAGKNWGLSCYESDMTEAQVMTELQAGHPIICSVGPGDFTQNGHFIVLAGCEGGKIKVNDPFSRATSSQLWDFERIKQQTKAMWVYSI